MKRSVYIRFMVIFSICTIGYLISFFGLLKFDLEGASSGGKSLLAMVPAVFVAGMFWASIFAIKRSDEYLLQSHARKLLYALVPTLLFTFFWGFGEAFAGWPDFPMLLVVPLYLTIWTALVVWGALRGEWASE